VALIHLLHQSSQPILNYETFSHKSLTSSFVLAFPRGRVILHGRYPIMIQLWMPYFFTDKGTYAPIGWA